MNCQPSPGDQWPPSWVAPGDPRLAIITGAKEPYRSILMTWVASDARPAVGLSYHLPGRLMQCVESIEGSFKIKGKRTPCPVCGSFRRGHPASPVGWALPIGLDYHFATEGCPPTKAAEDLFREERARRCAAEAARLKKEKEEALERRLSTEQAFQTGPGDCLSFFNPRHERMARRLSLVWPKLESAGFYKHSKSNDRIHAWDMYVGSGVTIFANPLEYDRIFFEAYQEELHGGKNVHLTSFIVLDSDEEGEDCALKDLIREKIWDIFSD